MNPTIPTHLTHTVCYAKKVSDGNYGSEEATFFMQFDTPLGADATMVMAAAANAFAAAKSQVEYELGINNFEQPAAVEMSVEDKIRAEFGGAQVVEQPTQPAAAPAAAAPVADVTYDPFTKDKAEQAHNKQWALAKFREDPSQFWDNRESKRNPKAPDYKHKDTGIGLWADDVSSLQAV